MSNRFPLRFFGALGLIGVTGALWAADASAPAIESAFKLGEHWYGPEVTMEDLKGHVVLVEDWGRN